MASKRSGTPKATRDLPDDVATMVGELERFLNQVDPATGRRPANARCGIYAFYDYDGEPIYVGQTVEQLRVRIRRHLTNQRTDAVAMRVLDPLEVAEVEIWPFWNFDAKPGRGDPARAAEITQTLNAAEYTVYRQLIAASKLQRMLNEKIPAPTPLIALPSAVRGTIVPPDLRARLGHPDLRIARRALKIAELAGIIAQRDVSVGLRNTLITQAERVLRLAQVRFDQITAGQTMLEVQLALIGVDTDDAEDAEPD